MKRTQVAKFVMDVVEELEKIPWSKKHKLKVELPINFGLDVEGNMVKFNVMVER